MIYESKFCILLKPCILFQKNFYRRTVTTTRLSFILLLIPLLFTACATLPQDSHTIPEKNAPFESRLLAFYNGPLNHLNGVRRGHCPMYPSCSRYCGESLKKHGFFIGWMMTCDRLMRCGRDELALAPKVNINGSIKCFDPVTRNDWWWYDTQNQLIDVKLK